jgi:stage IV sporulation protein B
MKKAFIYLTIFSIFIISGSAATIETKAETTSENTVILGGNPFGIKMFSDGVMVIKTENVRCEDKEYCPAEKADIREDDIIIALDNNKLRSNEELAEIIESSQGRTLKVTIKRDDKTFDVKLTPCKNTQGKYKAGIWVRDSAAGLGTITFYSEKTKGFCGLGHAICDKDTGMIIPLSYGEVVGASISDVTKSENSNVGTLNGYFTDEYYGTAKLNCKKGIYGKNTIIESGREIEISPSESVKTGYAQIYTTISGTKPELYDVEIIRLYRTNNETDMVIRITDEELIKETGGIVQGMSGSPILQNNRLVGALTHVIVDNVVCGYGIYADEMLETLIESCG